ncbi:hypothetical protein HGRIS_003290 [Hohenbuehelia grisea]|uniref:NACHT domain-containing protein n=1 Tax=Hohenbuehelia grisea TaxID=104357 RepID=A0ABR3JMZ7_9AGAR
MSASTPDSRTQWIRVTFTYLKSSYLPRIPKSGLFTTTRRLCATLSVDGAIVIAYDLPLDDSKAPPITFLTKQLSTLDIKLFAKRNRHDDILLGDATELLDFGGQKTCEVSFMAPQDTEYPLSPNHSFVFELKRLEALDANETDIATMQKSLEINSRWIKALGHFNSLIRVVAPIVDSIPIAKPVVELVGLLGSVIEEVIKRNESVLRLVETIGQASVLMADWDDPDLDSQRPHQQRVYEALLPAINQSLRLLWTLSEGNIGKRLKESSINAVEASREQLDKLVHKLESNQSLDTQVAVFKSYTKITDLHDQSCLSTLPCGHFVGIEESKACLPNTRVDLLSQIREWALSPLSKRSLLLNGAAGKGKSAIMNAIALELEREGLATVLFFAFNRRVPDRSSAQLFPCWSKHLGQRNARFLKYLHDLEHYKRGNPDLVSQKNLLVQGLSDIDNGRPLIFVIDALDECPKHQARDMFVELRKLLVTGTLPSYVRFLFSSRADEEILSIFELDSPVGNSCLNIAIDNQKDTAHDIRKYVEAQLLHENPDVANLVDAVCEAAETLFECAAMLCRELAGSRRPISDHQALVERLAKEPRSLHTTYNGILNMYFGQDVGLLKLFPHVMSWILLLKSPQPREVLHGLADALGHNQQNIDKIINWLGALLSGTSIDGSPISPLHTSLRDFLVDPAKSRQFYVDLGSHAQEELAFACLRIMNTKLKFNMCQLPASFTLNADIEHLDKRVEKHILPDLRYACREVAYHLVAGIFSTDDRVLDSRLVQSSSTGVAVAMAFLVIGICLASWTALIVLLGLLVLYANRSKMSLSQPTRAPPVTTELGNFLQRKFLFWLEVHSCMQTQGEGPGSILSQLLQWTAATRCESLQPIISDFIKFEQRFRQGYLLSASQVYCSGLAFAPRHSEVARIYGPQFSERICVAAGYDWEWPQLEPRIIHNDSQVNAVAISPDGTRIVSGSYDKTIRIWDATTGEQVGEALRGHEAGVMSVAFSHDGTRIVSGSYDKTIRIWDATTGEQVGEALRGHEAGVMSVAFSHDGTRIVSGSYDKTIRIWDATTGEQVGEALRGHEAGVNSVAFSHDGTHIVSGSSDNTIRIWDATTGEQVGEALSGHDDWVRSVAFSHDGTRIVSGSSDNTIRIWDATTGEQVGEALRGHKAGVMSVAFSHDGTRIVSGSYDKTIRIWDATTGEQVGEALSGHDDWVRSVAFSHDGARIVSGSDDRTIRIWDATTDGMSPRPPSIPRPCRLLRSDEQWITLSLSAHHRAPILWIPHIFRQRPFLLYPCLKVCSRLPIVVVTIDEALLEWDWRKIKIH